METVIERELEFNVNHARARADAWVCINGWRLRFKEPFAGLELHGAHIPYFALGKSRYIENGEISAHAMDSMKKAVENLLGQAHDSGPD